MMDTLADLRNNKSKRTQAANIEVVKAQRKWIGSIKSALGSKSGDLCLRVSVQDLLEVDQKGRWWIAGASWKPCNDAKPSPATESVATSVLNNVLSSEESALAKAALSMRMSGIRKSIFMVVMSSRDVGDAFERIARLDLKGKQDREVVRVLVECCGKEKTYNSFYGELIAHLAAQNRQYKTTVQFAYWDTFKNFVDGDERPADRKIMNLARMLASLICGFHLSLAVVKPLDITSQSHCTSLFLSTLLLSLFSTKVLPWTQLLTIKRVII